MLCVTFLVVAVLRSPMSYSILYNSMTRLTIAKRTGILCMGDNPLEAFSYMHFGMIQISLSFLVPF